MSMTDREKKHAVALALLSQAGDLVEFWTEKTDHEEWAGEIDAEFARACIAGWLNRLPGTMWDVRLDAPNIPETETGS